MSAVQSTADPKESPPCLFVQVGEPAIDLAADIYARFRRRVMPVMIILSIIAFLDRQNISFAKLQMAGDLGLSEGIYALGAAMFYIGYILLDVPSNMMLARMAAGKWFAIITAGWGFSTIALAFTPNPVFFYMLRFLLGAFEAGFLPGIVYLSTLWLPFSYRARVVGAVMGAGVFSFVIGGPICGSAMDMNGLLGLRGWQWVFLATGLPAVLIAPALIWLLPPSPERTDLYTDAQKNWLADTLAAEHPDGMLAHANPLSAFADPRIVAIALPLAAIGFASMGLNYWLPTIIHAFGVSNTANGMLSAIPWLAAVIGCWWLPARAERLNERRIHCAVPSLIAAVALGLVPFFPHPATQLILLSAGAAGIFATIPIFWTLPSRFLRGASAATGIGALGALGNIGGGSGQIAVGVIRDVTGSVSLPMLTVAGALVVAAFLTLRLIRADGSPAIG